MIPPPPTSTLFPYTTLVRHCFSDKPYVNLEAVDDREYATEDPRGFLAQFPQGAILDEVQHAPELLSYLQVLVDENPTSGQFILTGSENLTLSQAAAQSLAGGDRKSTRLNSSHVAISYAVFCLKKKT